MSSTASVNNLDVGEQYFPQSLQYAAFTAKHLAIPEFYNFAK